MSDKLPMMFPQVWPGNDRPFPEETVCAEGDKFFLKFCLRFRGHKGKHCNHKGERW